MTRKLTDNDVFYMLSICQNAGHHLTMACDPHGGQIEVADLLQQFAEARAELTDMRRAVLKDIHDGDKRLSAIALAAGLPEGVTGEEIRERVAELRAIRDEAFRGPRFHPGDHVRYKDGSGSATIVEMEFCEGQWLALVVEGHWPAPYAESMGYRGVTSQDAFEPSEQEGT